MLKLCLRMINSTINLCYFQKDVFIEKIFTYYGYFYLLLNWLFKEKELITSSSDQQQKISLPLDFKEATGNSRNYGTFIKEVTLPTE